MRLHRLPDQVPEVGITHMPNRLKAALFVGALAAMGLSMAAVWKLIPMTAAVVLIALVVAAVALVVVSRGLARRSDQPKDGTRALVGLGGSLLVGAILASVHAARHGWAVGDSIGSVVFVALFTGYVFHYLKTRKSNK